MKSILITSLILISVCILPRAHAYAIGDAYIDPNVGVGFNSSQGTVIRLGLDLGYHFTENIYGGVGAYYAAGDHPTHDREIGGGPFVGYVQPLLSFLSAHIREEINYVDVRVPILVGSPATYSAHENEYGIESATTLGVSVSFSQNFGLFAGYRIAIGLTNSDIADGRSGPAFGLSIGF